MARRSVVAVLCATFVMLVSAPASARPALNEHGRRDAQSAGFSLSPGEIVSPAAQPASEVELTISQAPESEGAPALENRPDQNSAGRVAASPELDEKPTGNAALAPSSGENPSSDSAVAPLKDTEGQPSETAGTHSSSVEGQPASTVPQPPSNVDGKPSDAATAPQADDQPKHSDTAATPPSDTDAQPSDTAATPPSESEPQPSNIAATRPSDAGQQPANTGGQTTENGSRQAPDDSATAAPTAVGQPLTDTDQSPSDAPNAAEPILAAPPPPPVDTTVAEVRARLADASLRKGAASGDLAALEVFYGELTGAPLWITTSGFSSKAQSVIKEIEQADDWGLSAEALDAPPAGDAPSTTEAQAINEIKLSLAVLKYARFARGGRISPLRVSALFDQRPPLIDPKVVLTEIAASADPASYLRGLHPRHEQFEQLRQVLKAGAEGEENGADDQRLVMNMERWRWMPAELGSTYVWNNIPEFITRVVKNGKIIYAERIIVGKLKYPTSIFSATMRSIMFHPAWVVPPTIVKEDLKPALQRGGPSGGPSTDILEQRNLKVRLKGRPVDADTVDWKAVNIRHYTFIQPPGPGNALGTLKFNFPNRHAVYMHDTPQRELFAETIRTLSHGCIRVREPDRLAALLLAEDKGWSAEQVKSLLARDKSSVVKLNWPVPVHLTYFTVVVDEKGKVETFPDVYGVDGRMSAALFGKSSKFPAATVEAKSETE
jgi:murein L,D-transpeptidase YcbB/YkuD